MKQKLLLKTMLLLCALVVGSGSAWAVTYKLTKVTSVSAGNKYVFERNGHVLNNTFSSSALQTTDTYSTTGLAGTEAYVWTLESAKNGFYLKNVSIGATSSYLTNSSGTGLRWDAKISDWTIEFTDGVALISNTSNSNRFLGDAGGDNPNNTYKAYATSNLSSYQHDFTVYMLEEETAGSDPAAFLSATSLAFGRVNIGNPKALTFTITPANLTSDLTIASNNSKYTVSPTSIAQATTTETTITVTAAPTATNDDMDGTITISGGGLDANKTVSLSTIVRAADANDGTAAKPYTVAEAIELIDEDGPSSDKTGKHVKGIISRIDNVNTTDGWATYWISDDGTVTNQFEIYKGKGISGTSFSSTDDIKVGDIVVAKGDMKKFDTTYEFNTGSQLVSLEKPVTPLIITTPTSLINFTYSEGFGPSDAQTFSVEGSNLTADISISLGESNYEMSLTEGSGYTNSLTLSQTAGAVAATTIYVRLKAGLAVNASYNGNIALTSTGATDKAVSLAGSVTQPNFTWDLSTDNTATASSTELTWTGAYASMGVQKGASTTDANNYYPGTSGKTYTSTRFYSNSYLTIAPTSGNTITSIEFTATSSTYATALKNSTWSNASAAVDDKTVTITPTNGALPISATVGATCGFTAVKIYYGIAAFVTLTPAKTYTTLTSSHNLDFTSVSSDLKAYVATEVSGGNVQMTQVNKVPAGTGLVLEATTPGSAVNIPVFDGTGADNVTTNKMAGSATATTAVAANAGYILSEGIFQPADKGTLAAGKAYLNIAVSAGAPILTLYFGNGETTDINDVRSKMADVSGDFFDLQGRKVANPTKGLYIVNGRKVVIK